jgi:hypothetical protein
VGRQWLESKRCSGSGHACSFRSWAVKRGEGSGTFIRRIFISFVANTVTAIEPVVRIIHRFDRLELCIVGPPTRIAPIRLCSRVVVETNACHLVWDKLTKSSLGVWRRREHGPNRISHAWMNSCSVVGNIVYLSSQKVVDGA